MEYDIARQMGKNIYVLVCKDDFEFDSGSKPEPADKLKLQAAHRQAVLDRKDEMYHLVADDVDLRRKIEHLKVSMDLLRAELEAGTTPEATGCQTSLHGRCPDRRHRSQYWWASS